MHAKSVTLNVLPFSHDVYRPTLPDRYESAWSDDTSALQSRPDAPIASTPAAIPTGAVRRPAQRSITYGAATASAGRCARPANAAWHAASIRPRADIVRKMNGSAIAWRIRFAYVPKNDDAERNSSRKSGSAR